MSELRVNAITNAAGGNTATINGMTPTADSLQGFRNRILNGSMVLDQRNAGASVTPTSGQYLLDRYVASLTQASKFSIQQNAGAVTPPVGFTNYLGATSLSAYSVASGDAFAFSQIIEGFNISDLGWGTANAQTVTLSFWVRSSLTGTFGGSLRNGGGTRSYPYTYTINSANTWEQKSITIAGDTSGTWLTTNGNGVRWTFALGAGSTFSGTAGAWAGSNFASATGAVSVVGTSGATFYITGVQLEAGSVATPFERRPYGTELALCQRYYQKLGLVDVAPLGSGYGVNTTQALFYTKYTTTMRSSPTSTFNSLYLTNSTNNYAVTTAGTSYLSVDSAMLRYNVASGAVAGGACILTCNTSAGYVDFSAEL